MSAKQIAVHLALAVAAQLLAAYVLQQLQQRANR
jgi:hypothetical protein